MATAKICDRCGGVYGRNAHYESFNDESYGTVRGVCVMFEETDKFRKNNSIVVDGIRPMPKNHYVDLCDECSKQLTLFLRDKDAQIVTGNKVRF